MADAQAQRDSQLRFASSAAVTIALLLIAIKTYALIRTGSDAVLGALLDSCMDAAASLVNFYAIRHALTPADDDHRFGHGKAESLAALAQTVFITLSALGLGARAIYNIYVGNTVEAPTFGIGAMFVSMLGTAVLVSIQKRTLKNTHSTAIAADLLHYTGDFLLHLSVALSLFLGTIVDAPWLDGAFALLVAAHMLRGAFHITWQAVNELMDRELPREERKKIYELVESHPKVLGAHDLKTRIAGGTTFIQVHIHLGAKTPLDVAHGIGLEIQELVHKEIPGADIIMHFDPHDDRKIEELD